MTGKKGDIGADMMACRTVSASGARGSLYEMFYDLHDSFVLKMYRMI